MFTTVKITLHKSPDNYIQRPEKKRRTLTVDGTSLITSHECDNSKHVERLRQCCEQTELNSVQPYFIEGLVMKPCHDNNINGAAIYVGRAPTNRAQSFVLTFTVQLNILIGTFLLVSCSNRFQNLCTGSRPKMLTKTCNKDVCQAS